MKSSAKVFPMRHALAVLAVAASAAAADTPPHPTKDALDQPRRHPVLRPRAFGDGHAILFQLPRPFRRLRLGRSEDERRRRRGARRGARPLRQSQAAECGLPGAGAAAASRDHRRGAHHGGRGFHRRPRRGRRDRHCAFRPGSGAAPQPAGDGDARCGLRRAARVPDAGRRHVGEPCAGRLRAGRTGRNCCCLPQPGYEDHPRRGHPCRRPQARSP